MKLSLNWLNDFVNVKDIDIKDLSDGLIKAGFEVESIENLGKGMERVFVGEIKKLDKHPNADKLQICTIDVGFETVQIITAATNVFEGALVPVALDGADLPSGVLIKTTNMRGIESQGMLCSGQELKIDNTVYDGAEIDGIMILHEDYKPGTNIAEVIGYNDYVLDINVLSNRPDCNSVIGLAKEIAVIFDKEFKMPDLSYVETDDEAKNYIDVDIDTDRCLRYMAGVVKDLKICESPKIIKQRLNAVGIRSINNIVDITNYVLIEIGQPMHSFDYDKINGGVIEIRNAKANEQVLALNMEEYELDKNDTVIADKNGILAIAGVMGGFKSGINSMSKNLLFESATFARDSIRTSSKKLGLSSDSSNRYEKGVEPAFCELGLKRALNIIYTNGYGKICKGIVEDCLIDMVPKKLEIDLNYINKLLAINISYEQAKDILEKLDFKVSKKQDNLFEVVAPIYRSDIQNSADIAEEIIRIYGFDNVVGTLLENTSYKVRKDDIVIDNISKIKNLLVNKGYYELNTFTLSNLDYIKKLRLENVNEKEIISISNPLNNDLKYLRTAMADSVLNVVASNNNYGNKQLKLFEIARVYKRINDLPKEINVCSFALTGKNLDFFNSKGIVEQIGQAFGLKFDFEKSDLEFLNNYKSAIIKLDNKTIGYIGFVHPTTLKSYGINEDVILCEINIDEFISLEVGFKTFKLFSKLPSVSRDLSFVVPNELSYATIEDEIKNSSGKYCTEISLIDVYEGNNIGSGNKSLTFRLKFQKFDGSFTDDEIEKIVSKVIRTLQYKLNINLREI